MPLVALFANPAFLLGIAAAGAPVAIHLLSRWRAKPLPFPSIRFLRRTVDRTASRRHLEEVLLLLLRAGALALLALALAGPRLPAGGGWLGQGASSTLVLVDTSLSMQQRVEGETAILQARRVLGDLLPALPRTAAWAVRPTVAPGKTPPAGALGIHPPTLRAEAVAPEALAATEARGWLAALLPAAIADLRARAGRRELILLTDGQRREWDELESRLEALPAGPEITIFLSLPRGVAQDNRSVRRLETRARAALVGQEGALEATLANAGARSARAVVSLRMAEATVERRAVDLPPDGTAAWRARLPLAKPGWLTGMVHLDEDACVADNRRYFALPVRATSPVWILPGEAGPTEAVGRGPAFYVQTALAPLAGYPVRPRLISVADLARLETGAEWWGVAAGETEAGSAEAALPDAVFLLECDRLPETARHALRTYVARGGTLVLMPGAGVEVEAFNRTFGPAEDPRGGLTPALLGARRDLGTEGLGLAPGEVDHPLLGVLATGARDSLRRARILQGFHFEPLPADAPRVVRVALQDARGEAVILTAGYGRGMVVLWAAPPRAGWTRLQGRPVFVPLIHQHLRLARADDAGEGLVCGAPLPIAAPETPMAIEATILDPVGTEHRRASDGASRANPLVFEETGRAGVYTVRLRARAIASAVGTGTGAGTDGRLIERRYAVNPHPDESDLALVSRERLERALGRFGPVRIVDTPAALEAELRAAREGADLTPLLFGLVIGLLVAEAIYGAGRVRHALAEA